MNQIMSRSKLYHMTVLTEFVLITNLMQNSFILYYMYYIKYFDMFRAIVRSSSGGQIVFLQHLVSSLSERPYSAPDSVNHRNMKNLCKTHLYV
jgi:hypothetical protein